MPLTAERFDARSWPDDQLDTLFGGAFPAFITAGQVAKQYIGRVRERAEAPDTFVICGGIVSPAGLSTLHIDREHDCGTYTEPNVWVQHR
jgi:hypothetical protein